MAFTNRFRELLA